jgi:hypothetical protein
MRGLEVAFLLVTILSGQATPDSPQPRSIQGVVVDEAGAPVSDVFVAHTGTKFVRGSGENLITDRQGRFQVTTQAPLIVFRKRGYAGAVLRPRDVAPGVQPRLVLERTQRTLPICSPAGTYYSLEGWEASLRFAPDPRIQATAQGRDVDYGIRGYLLKGSKDSAGVTHGSGPLWSFGSPLDSDVWQSTVLADDTFEAGGHQFVDSRGTAADGTRWRSIGKLGETASYSRVDKEFASVLDQFLDGACVAPHTPPGR